MLFPIHELTIREKIELFANVAQEICNEGIRKEVLTELIERECMNRMESFEHKKQV